MAKCPSDEASNSHLMRTLPQLENSRSTTTWVPHQSNTHPNYNTVVKNNTTCIRLGEVRDVSRFLCCPRAVPLWLDGDTRWTGHPLAGSTGIGRARKSGSPFFRFARGLGTNQQAHPRPGLHVRPLQIALGLCVRSSVPSRAGTARPQASCRIVDILRLAGSN